MFICNAFSLQMLDLTAETRLAITPVSTEEVKALALTSAVGHPDTAAVLGDILGQEIPANRVNVKLGCGDSLIVAQLTGGRLPEGATTLPDGFSFAFVKVTVT